MTIPRKEQFSGCLIGQCLGDALGFPVEGYPPSVCGQYINRIFTGIMKSGQVEEPGRPPFPFGQYSDDSQLARELLQSYIVCQRFDPSDYASRIAALFTEGRIVGAGEATSEAAWRVARGIPWDKAGTPAPSAGNGSAMRAGPIGLMFFDQPQELIRAAHDQSRITHQDRRCSAGAAAIAGAVALALVQRPIDVSRFLVQLSDWCLAIDPSFADALKGLAGWVSLPPDEAANRICEASGIATHSANRSCSAAGISPFVVSSVLFSLYAFLKAPSDYQQAITTAIAAGGDTDTLAAMTGAISGAYLGLEGLPSALFPYLTDQGSWGWAELVELAHQSYELKMRYRII